MDVSYKNPKIYLLAGKAKHGKSTSSIFIKEEYEARGQKVAIARYSGYIKSFAKNYFGWDGREETKPRELLQQLGTQIIREKLNKEDFFVKRMIEDIEILSYFFDAIIIDDVRLEIEIEEIKKVFKNTISINVIRNNFDNGLTEKQKKHRTETALDDYNKFDYYIYNNGTFDDLKQSIIDIMKKVGVDNEKDE